MTHGINVSELGAKGDGISDDTAPIQTAIDIAASLPYGGSVFVSPGQYMTSGIMMNTRVSLGGVGPQSILSKLPGSSLPILYLANNAVNHTVVRDLYLDGNRQAGGQGHGIEYVNSEDHQVIRLDELFGFHGDPQHRIFNVHIFNANATGMRLFTRACHVDHCHISRCQVGLDIPGSDNVVAACDINNMFQRGAIVEGGNNLLATTKFWYIGTDPAWTKGDGVYWRASRGRMIGCEFQDISRHGLVIAVADSVNACGTVFDNIGNLYQAQGIGYNHGSDDRYAVMFEDGNNGPRCNYVQGVVTNRSTAVGLSHAVALSPMAKQNQVFLTCESTNVRTTFVKSNGATNNYVKIN